MNILIDIGHPAHVHLFKNFYFYMRKHSHNVLVSTKKSSAIVQLLKIYKIDFVVLPSKKDNILQKISSQFRYDIQIYNLSIKNKIDIAIGSSISIAHAAFLRKTKSIILDDDDDKVEPLFVKFAHPFCDTLLSPDCLIGNRKRKDTIFYSGYHELAYLHPNNFTPDKTVLKEMGLKENEIFFIMRFNVFKAHHDIGVSGLNIKQKLKLINLLELSITCFTGKNSFSFILCNNVHWR